jgi:hypothetical protein
VFYDIVFTYVPLFKGDGNLPFEFVSFMVLIDLFMIGVLVWFYGIIKDKDKKLKRVRVGHNIQINNLGYIVILCAAVFLFYFLVYRVFGDYDLRNVYLSNQRFYSQSKVGTSWVFFFLYSFVFVSLYDVYKNGFTNFKMISILLLILINAATGGRGNVITYLFLFILIYGVTWRGKNLVVMGGGVFILIAATFAYNTLSRSSSGDVVEYLESNSSTADLNQVYATRDSLDYWLDNGACYSCFFEDLTFFFLPRYIYPNKPISNAETRLVYPEVAARGSSYTFGIYGSTLINLGAVTFVFIPIFYFLYAYSFFSSLYSKRKTFMKFFFIYCGVNAVQFVRGGVFDVRLIRLFVTFILAYLIYRFFIFLFGKVRR